MIQVFVGDDTLNARTAMERAILDHSGRETANIKRFNDVGFSPQEANEAIFEQNLFGGENIVVFDGVLDAPEAEGFFTVSLKTSPNRLFIRETAPNKDILDIFKKLGTIQTFSLAKKEKKSPIAFALADAYCAKDKKRTWVLYRKAVSEGAQPEELHGTIFWVTKLLYLSTICNREDAIAGGVSAYNYGRYVAWSKKFLLEELDENLRILKNMYHEAHRSDKNLEYMLERFLIK